MLELPGVLQEASAVLNAAMRGYRVGRHGSAGEALVRSRGTGIGVHHGGAATLSRTPSAAAPTRTGPR